MKLDINSPGVCILGAYPYERLQGPNNREPVFKIEAGISFACPHLRVPTLLKSMHPNWTGAMIKSAMMKTTDVTDNIGSPILDEKNSLASYFAMGAGHVNAAKATDPGLVYDIKSSEYLSYLCGLGYNASMINKITVVMINEMSVLLLRASLNVTDNIGSPILDEKNSLASYFAMGAGHVNAAKATDPGLVYDIKSSEYLSYLCGLGYNASMINKITGGDDS
ncbi:hypothetical protein J5N97_024732 [Dioscorea zingiberensis]|uniref:Peptidase S8/S53 domain-containing protein n=1 Tax=Dioscorea zingiberensis TaxID=325984 RepID=A0A9D5H980_9LILI|nr:hypothetical protein J5N97_024732 [Dioscorea zingiberensis]